MELTEEDFAALRLLCKIASMHPQQMAYFGEQIGVSPSQVGRLLDKLERVEKVCKSAILTPDC